MRDKKSEAMAREMESIRRVLDGDAEAFTPLVRENQDMVARIAARHVPVDAVQDVAQEAFVRAFSSLARFEGRKPFAHWLSVIEVRACHDYWRKKGRARETVLSALSEDGQRWLDNMTASEAVERYERGANRKEAREVLDWAMERLKPTQRMALTLTWLEEYSVKEAASMLGISVANVKVQSYRGRKRLRTILEESGRGR